MTQTGDVYGAPVSYIVPAISRYRCELHQPVVMMRRRAAPGSVGYNFLEGAPQQDIDRVQRLMEQIYPVPEERSFMRRWA